MNCPNCNAGSWALVPDGTWIIEVIWKCTECNTRFTTNKGVDFDK